jgi:hypothetical protein
MNKYIGARYVPIFDSEASWKKTKPYEPLTIVSYQGDSYTSKTYVPTNIDITNTLYWAHTGNYNAQVEQYRQNVENVTVDLNNQILGIQNSKVDKVDGKGLSSNDYSAAEMAKVAGAVTDIDMLQLQISSVVSGAPKVATLASEMTDLAKTYVYTGAEAEHTNGHWYWYNGTAWTDGGQYFDSAITANLSKEIDNNVSCFEQQSDVNKIITNVVVVGSSGRRYAIGNINNNFSSFTGCVIYYTDDECTTLTNGKTITFVGTSGDMTVLLANGDTISFHFDVSFMADNTRIGTIAGKNILVSKNRYLFNGAMNTLNCFEDASGASVIISNVKVNGSTVNRYAIANINNNYTGFTGCLIYSSNDNGDLVSTLKTITFTATSGDISTTLTNTYLLKMHYLFFVVQ